MAVTTSPLRQAPTALPVLPKGTQFLDAFVIDINGSMLGKRLPASGLASAFEQGVQFSQAALVLDATGHGQNPAGIGGSDGDPDGTGYPIPGTVAPVTWAKDPTVQFVLDLVEPETREHLWYDPRQILQSVIERCEADGLRPVVACELEFYLLSPQRDAAGLAIPPVSPLTGMVERSSRNLSVQQVEDYHPFLSEVLKACKAQGVAASTVVAEYGLGQFEVNLDHGGDVLRAADEAALLRRIVKGVARAQGRDATFMSKPFLDLPGNGFHVHLSLADEKGRNRLGRQGGERLLEATVAGCQAMLPETMAIYSPNWSAYRRYAPGLFAPMNRHWGHNNRSVAFRIPAAHGAGRRLEHRVAAADASPHLVLAALLAAMHHGVTGNLTPTPPVVGNVGYERDPAFPGDIFAALHALETAAILTDYVPARFLRLYAELKRNEFAEIMRTITPREYDFYL
ncbi:MAG TPA: glutamine synthetase family protein [Stellaceae bacterium]|nr:glutamine synthetase family protein [Stellaceae bacterium]